MTKTKRPPFLLTSSVCVATACYILHAITTLVVLSSVTIQKRTIYVINLNGNPQHFYNINLLTYVFCLSSCFTCCYIHVCCYTFMYGSSWKGHKGLIQPNRCDGWCAFDNHSVIVANIVVNIQEWTKESHIFHFHFSFWIFYKKNTRGFQIPGVLKP